MHIPPDVFFSLNYNVITVSGTENFNLPYHLAFLANLDEICTIQGQKQSPFLENVFLKSKFP